jgi:protein-arginine kinase activator protein McsA
MKAIEKENTVKRMREIRDSLNKKIEDMDYHEEKAYIRQELEELKRRRQEERKK